MLERAKNPVLSAPRERTKMNHERAAASLAHLAPGHKTWDPRANLLAFLFVATELTARQDLFLVWNVRATPTLANPQAMDSRNVLLAHLTSSPSSLVPAIKLSADQCVLPVTTQTQVLLLVLHALSTSSSP